jgi:hypothetical protein
VASLALNEQGGLLLPLGIITCLLLLIPLVCRLLSQCLYGIAKNSAVKCKWSVFASLCFLMSVIMVHEA